MKRFERDPDLLQQYEIDAIPLLSVSNVRELLRAAMPLPQLSTQGAAELVVKHLAIDRGLNNLRNFKSKTGVNQSIKSVSYFVFDPNRTRSRKSRLRKRRDSPFES